MVRWKKFKRPSALEGEGREGERDRLGVTGVHRGAATTPRLPEALQASDTLPLKWGGGLLFSAQSERTP